MYVLKLKINSKASMHPYVNISPPEGAKYVFDEKKLMTSWPFC